MVPRNEIEDEADQVLLAQQLTREIIGRESARTLCISESCQII